MQDDLSLYDRILGVIRRSPGTEPYISRTLQYCRYRVWRALKDMTAAGIIYHRKYPVIYPSGSAFTVKVYFPAGMADGMTCTQDHGAPDLIDRLAAATIEQGMFVQKRNIAALKEMKIS